MSHQSQYYYCVAYENSDWLQFLYVRCILPSTQKSCSLCFLASTQNIDKIYHQHNVKRICKERQNNMQPGELLSSISFAALYWWGGGCGRMMTMIAQQQCGLHLSVKWHFDKLALTRPWWQQALSSHKISPPRLCRLPCALISYNDAIRGWDCSSIGDCHCYATFPGRPGIASRGREWRQRWPWPGKTMLLVRCRWGRLWGAI